MNADIRKLILRYSLWLAIGFTVAWLLFYEVFMPTARSIPYTLLNINGLLVIVYTTIILIRLNKKLLKQDPAISLGRLVLIGTVVCTLAEVWYQVVFKTFKGYGFIQDVQDALLSVLTLTIAGGILSFLISFQLKTKRTGLLILIIIAMLLVMGYMLQLFFMMP